MLLYTFNSNNLMQITIILSILSIVLGGAKVTRSSISIRGYEKPQLLPLSHMKSWDVYTYDFHKLSQVENEFSHDGWIYPSSVDTIFLPADLPKPAIEPALGVVLVHGTPRYIMPSIITTLETADRVWRNRGICSLPRSFAWIDLFAPFTPAMSDLKFSLFEKIAADVRFLEDQDGTTAWQSMIDRSVKMNSGVFRPLDTSTDDDRYCLSIDSVLKTFTEELKMKDQLSELRKEGFRIVDIPLPYNKDRLQLRGTKIKSYITDFLDPERLLEIEDANMLEGEPLAELDINVMPASAGRLSKYLPEVYKELYEEGAVLFS